jgi:transitional endoplasmic reticulum ATPase
MDSIAKVRGGGGFGGGDSAMDRIINQLLTEMDGISSTKQVFVIGATNRPEIIDPAIIRPGRLDRLIYIPLPDKPSRISVFEASLKNIPVDYKSCNIDFLADLTDGYSVADINEICQLASRTAMNDYMKENIVEKKVYGYHLENSVYETRRSVKQEDIQRYEIFIKRSGL